MITPEIFSELALEFPGTEQIKHFDRVGFKIRGKRMFSTLLVSNRTVNIFLNPEEQQVFCEMDPENIYPVPNKWGEKGATTFELDKISGEVLREALLSAYNAVLHQKKK